MTKDYDPYDALAEKCRPGECGNDDPPGLCPNCPGEPPLTNEEDSESDIRRLQGVYGEGVEEIR